MRGRKKAPPALLSLRYNGGVMEYGNKTNHAPMDERMARIETILERLDHELCGNGQPGFIQKTNDRLAKNDQERAWLKGGFAVISALVSALGVGGILHIFRGR